MSEIPEDVMEVAEKALDFGPDATRLKHSIAKAVLADRQRDQWQPIETIPINRTVLVFRKGKGMSVFTAADRHWRDAFEYVDDEPSHWRDMPDEPKGGE